MDFSILQAVKVFGVAIASFVVALLATPFVSQLLVKYQFNKQIRTSERAPVFSELHKKKEGTPTGGGLIIWLTVLILAFLFSFHPLLNFTDRAQTYLPLVTLAIAGLLGLADDILGILKVGPHGGGLGMRQKLALYTVVALVGALWFFYRLEWDVLNIPFYGNVNIGWYYVPFFMFIIIASAFSVNETDGLDGLAGGVMLFAFSALTVVAFTLGRFYLASFGAAIVGSLLAFLWFNIYPAKFFMGDTGSMALGITLGVIAMLTNTAFFLPFFAFIPVLESLSVIVQIPYKKLTGRKIFRSTPIHHHFEAIGWPESQITMRFWIISVVMTTIGLVLFFLNRFL